MSGKIMSAMLAAAGVEEVADMGVVFTRKYGYNDCTVLPRIETFDDCFLVCIEVVLSRGASFRNTKVVKWPYSRTDARDLDAVLLDLKCVAGSLENGCLEDRRSGIGRLFDKITGRQYLGEYSFKSPLRDDRPRTVTATATTGKAGADVSLREKRKSSESIIASLPLDAIAAVVEALETWRR